MGTTCAAPAHAPPPRTRDFAKATRYDIATAASRSSMNAVLFAPAFPTVPASRVALGLGRPAAETAATETHTYSVMAVTKPATNADDSLYRARAVLGLEAAQRV